MRIVTRFGINRQRGLGLFAGFLILASAAFVFAGQDSRVKILYFFSPSCRHCIDAKPFIMDLSKEYSIEGFRFGEGNTPPFSFPITAGDKKIAREKYDVKGVPTLAILIDGVYRQKIEGMPDIQDARVIIRGLAKGAVTVTEAAQRKKGELTITGWLIARGINFKKAQFFITDRRTELPVKAWLPREVVKSPVQKKRPKLMSDVVKTPLILKGSFHKSAAGTVFFVAEEVPAD